MASFSNRDQSLGVWSDDGSDEEPGSELNYGDESSVDSDEEVRGIPKSKRQFLSLEHTTTGVKGSSSSHGVRRSTKHTPSRDLEAVTKTRKSLLGKPSPRPHAPTPPESDQVITKTLSDLTNTLTKVVERLDRHETLLTTMEKKMSSASTPGSSSSGETKKPKIPLLVRSEVRRMYKALCEDDEEFLGFNTDQGVSFKDPDNTAVIDRLVKEVRSANPSFQSGLIRSASYTYFRTLCQENSLKRRGKLDERNRTRRRRERLVRKLQDRVSILKKCTMNEKDKKKWGAVLVQEFMSSEESDAETQDTLIKRPIPWRSHKVDTFFSNLDSHVEETKSAQAKRQAKLRTLAGEQSQRPKPQGESYPRWAFSVQI